MSRPAARLPRRRLRPVSFGSGGRAPWRRGFALLFAFALLLAAPWVARAQTGADSVALAWTAPGDDGTIGTATLYDLRMSSAPINASNWDQATVVGGLPAPMIAGTPQQITVPGLTRGTTYYFALRTRDDAGNWSGVSNVVRWDWVLDTAPPGAPTGLRYTLEGTTVHVRWNANPEPDLEGYSVFRAPGPSGPFTRMSGSLLATPAFDDRVPQGWPQAVYEVTATDVAGNESGVSAALTVPFSTSSVAVLQSPYPNPSHRADVVRIPVAVPAGGAVGTFVDVLDAGGRRVRRLSLESFAPGAQIATWDGRNQSGLAVAPGVYTLLLTSGDERQRVRLVRVP